MNKVSALICGMFVAAFLLGCSQEQPAVEAAPPSGNAKGESLKADAPERATLQVIPGTIDSCDVGATIDPMISWQRVDPSIQSTKVTTDNPANPNEKLFARGGFGGSSRAGKWVVAGTRFHVYDEQSGVELASYTVRTSKSCPN